MNDFENYPRISTGHWIISGHTINAPDGYPKYYCACSYCGTQFLEQHSRFCPYCGAKMSEPTDFLCNIPDIFREYYESPWQQKESFGDI